MDGSPHQPFRPGSRNGPPELAGRDDLRERLSIAADRTRGRLAAKGCLLVGLRGVGKTVLQKRILDDAEASGLITLKIEAATVQSLPTALLPALRIALLELSRIERARGLAERALRAMAGMLRHVKVKFEDVELVLDVTPERGLADSGDFGFDLQSLLEAVGEAAAAGDTALLLGLDEMQCIPTDELGVLVLALHGVAQKRLPLLLVGAGLPQLPGRLGRARSYAERLLTVEPVDALQVMDAALAIEKPLRVLGVGIEPAGLQEIVRLTEGYAYFLQEWGKHAWDVAEGAVVTAADVAAATPIATAALDASFFRFRFDQLTPKEKEYLRAMAGLGPGPHRSGDVAAALGRKVESVAPLRNGLIGKGMIWSSAHGDTAFTVPLFDAYLRRVMPEPRDAPLPAEGSGGSGI